MKEKAEILRKVIDKARKNGWEFKHTGWNYMYEWMSTQPYAVGGFLFSHDFARAFWGKKEVCNYDGSPILDTDKGKYAHCELNNHHGWEVEFLESWQYHLQKMVLYENPLEYIEKFI